MAPVRVMPLPSAGFMPLTPSRFAPVKLALVRFDLEKSPLQPPLAIRTLTTGELARERAIRVTYTILVTIQPQLRCRCYLSSLSKQGVKRLSALETVFNGQPRYPSFA
jgi:hypothetical protein